MRILQYSRFKNFTMMKKAPFLKNAHYAYGGETVVASSAANHPINGLIALETGSVRSESVFPVPYKTYSIHTSPKRHRSTFTADILLWIEQISR